MNLKYYKISVLIPLILILTFLITPISNWIESEISKIEGVNVIYSYIGIFSTISVLMIILYLINNCLWKYSCLKALVDLPDLNGRYDGVLESTYIDPTSQQPIKKRCVLEIKQTASYIKIHSYYGDLNNNIQSSCSTSVSEEIIKSSNDIFEIFYIYTNDANSLLTQLHNHKGTCSLKYYPDIKTLEGEYYNQRGFQGTIKVTFSQKKNLGRLI